MSERYAGWRTLLALLVAGFASPASADYLYDLWNGQEHAQPYVMVILDTSGSMAETDENEASHTCPYGFDDKNGDGSRRWQCSYELFGLCLDNRHEPCLTRMDAAKAAMQRTLPRIATDVGLGLMTFAPQSQGGTVPPSSESDLRNADRLNCGVKTIAAPPADYDSLRSAIDTAAPVANTPLEWSLKKAQEQLQTVRNQDGAECREYYVILVTDGEDVCARGTTDNRYPSQQGADLVVEQIEAMREDGIRTFVIGFGSDLTDTDGTSNASRFARAGGTAVNDEGEFVCWNDTTCGGDDTARAMFAYASDELDEALQRSFDEVRTGVFSAAEPVIGSVPLQLSEVDRVARNLLIYSSFEKRGDQLRGKLYGIRLYQEEGAYTGAWNFTDLTDPEKVLSNCAPDQTCVFEAGSMLVGRTDRRIYTGIPGTPITDEGGFTVPVTRLAALTNDTSGRENLAQAWGDFSALGPIKAALQNDQLPKHLSISGGALRTPSSSLYRSVVRWLHGVDRDWPLGDMYHGSPAITEPPSYGYRDRGYMQFRMNNQRRPWMIYVGANDGMIHAFYGSPDLEQPDEPRWEPGEEAWAYLPMNMIGRTISEVHAGSQRFFSQDLSCRYTDVILDDKVNDERVLDCGDDPNCGWATVLLCGQGWGGSWYVAIDVTDPTQPRPLWEMTVPDAVAGGGGNNGGNNGNGNGNGNNGGGYKTDSVGLGRTWSVPAINLINYKGKPTWMALFGNGYNSDMADCPSWKSNNGTCSGSQRLASYRMLNLPFDGAWPYFGDGTTGDRGHAYLVDMKDGRLRKLLHMHAAQGNGQDMMAIVADVASIDSDGNGLIDAAYLGGWDGSMARVPFGDTRTDELGDLDQCTVDGETLFHLGSSKPITSNPAVVRHPTRKDLVYLFAGSGVDGGVAPDQQRNMGNQWEFRAFHFVEEGKKECITTPNNAGNLCKKSDWKLNDRERLLAQPVFTRQRDGSEWVLYTTWIPPVGECAAGGEARLYCLDVTHALAPEPTCRPCGDLDGDAEHEPERYAVIETGGVPPTPPVIADGHVYVGPTRTPILDEDGEAQSPGGNLTRTVTVSWREIF